MDIERYHACSSSSSSRSCSPRFCCSGDGVALLHWQYLHKLRGCSKLSGPAFLKGQGVAQGPVIRGGSGEVESRARWGDISKEGLRATEERDHREVGIHPWGGALFQEIERRSLSPVVIWIWELLSLSCSRVAQIIQSCRACDQGCTAETCFALRTNKYWEQIAYQVLENKQTMRTCICIETFWPPYSQPCLTLTMWPWISIHLSLHMQFE